jgi:hypothetical protein
MKKYFMIKDAYSGLDWYVTFAHSPEGAMGNYLRKNGTIKTCKPVDRPEPVPTPGEDTVFYDVYEISSEDYEGFASGKKLLLADTPVDEEYAATYRVEYMNREF